MHLTDLHEVVASLKVAQVSTVETVIHVQIRVILC